MLKALSSDDLDLPLDFRLFTDWELAGLTSVMVFASLLVLKALSSDDLDLPLDFRLFTDWELAGLTSVMVFVLLVVLTVFSFDGLDIPFDFRLFTDWELAGLASFVLLDVFPWALELDWGTFGPRWRFCGLLVVLALFGRLSFGRGDLGLDVIFFKA